MQISKFLRMIFHLLLKQIQKFQKFLRVVFLPVLSPLIKRETKLLFIVALFFPIIFFPPVIGIFSYLLPHFSLSLIPNVSFCFILWFAVFYPSFSLYMVFLNNLLEYKKREGHSYSIKNILLDILKIKHENINDVIILLSILLMLIYVYFLISVFLLPMHPFVYLYVIIVIGLILYMFGLLTFAGFQDKKAGILLLSIIATFAISLSPFVVRRSTLHINTQEIAFKLIIPIFASILASILAGIINYMQKKTHIYKIRKWEKWSIFFDDRLLVAILITVFPTIFIFSLFSIGVLVLLFGKEIVYFSIKTVLIGILAILFISLSVQLLSSFWFLRDFPKTLLTFFSSWKEFFDCYYGNDTHTISDENLNRLIKIKGECMGISFNREYEDHPFFEQSFWLKLIDREELIEVIRFKEILPIKKSVWEGDKIIAIGFPRKIYDNQEKDFRYIFEAHYIETITNQ